MPKAIATHPAQPRPGEKLENFIARQLVQETMLGRDFSMLHEDFLECLYAQEEALASQILQ